MSGEPIPDELVRAFLRAINAFELLRRGHPESEQKYAGFPHNINWIADEVAKYDGVMCDPARVLLVEVCDRPALVSRYLKEDGTDSWTAGIKLLRHAYDDLLKSRAAEPANDQLSGRRP